MMILVLNAILFAFHFCYIGHRVFLLFRPFAKHFFVVVVTEPGILSIKLFSSAREFCMLLTVSLPARPFTLCLLCIFHFLQCSMLQNSVVT